MVDSCVTWHQHTVLFQWDNWHRMAYHFGEQVAGLPPVAENHSVAWKRFRFWPSVAWANHRDGAGFWFFQRCYFAVKVKIHVWLLEKVLIKFFLEINCVNIVAILDKSQVIVLLYPNKFWKFVIKLRFKLFLAKNRMIVLQIMRLLITLEHFLKINTFQIFHLHNLGLFAIIDSFLLHNFEVLFHQTFEGTIPLIFGPNPKS